MLALAGMSGPLAWLGILPPRDQLLHLTGQMQELKLRNPDTGAFTSTLLPCRRARSKPLLRQCRSPGWPACIDRERHYRHRTRDVRACNLERAIGAYPQYVARADQGVCRLLAG